MWEKNVQIYNREVSWLAFNDRVLQEAQDITVPLIQRLRFLGIFSNNQDEFIKVRVANLMRLSRIRGDKIQKTMEGFPVIEILKQVNSHMAYSQRIFSRVYTEILEEMESHHIYILNEQQINNRQRDFCREYFTREVSPWLVPLMVRKSTQLPFLTDNDLYLAVRMSLSTRNSHKYALIRIPVSRATPRFVELPSVAGRKELIFLDDVIRLCLNEIFFMFNYDEITAHTFQIIRDAQLTVDDDISKSIIEKVEQGLEGRLHGDPVRLIYDSGMPPDLLELIMGKLKLRKYDIMGGGRYHMMKHLMKFPVVDRSLEYEEHTPLPHPSLNRLSSILRVIREKDIFLNYPYHTFDHLIDFLREAAIDPKVTTICITLYRTAERSRVINALINAAENGKQVIVLEELMARFDEEQNVENSDLLQKVGIRVIHGFKALKVHCKLIYVERREKGHCRGYAYIGTGNFNETTARIYGDFGLFTTHEQIVHDVRGVFDFLQNTHKHLLYRHLLVSPYYMRSRIEKMIEREIKNSRKGKKASICAKFNGLTDVRMIRLLYKASQAGVEIRLIIRGACCLHPQMQGLSDHIRAISIVDRYLEHARLMIFHNDGEEQTYITSGDWMTRNLDNRIEVAVPIYDPEIRHTIRDIFEIQWADNVKARDLTLLGSNAYVKPEGEPPCHSQIELYEYYKQNIEVIYAH
ncbi:MAG: polyphosphate kinase 1 [Bacteroides sp.]|nr:polyphosphate kinase 1 [Bacteroides sp.]